MKLSGLLFFIVVLFCIYKAQFLASNEVSIFVVERKISASLLERKDVLKSSLKVIENKIEVNSELLFYPDELIDESESESESSLYEYKYTAYLKPSTSITVAGLETPPIIIDNYEPEINVDSEFFSANDYEENTNVSDVKMNNDVDTLVKPSSSITPITMYLEPDLLDVDDFVGLLDF